MVHLFGRVSSYMTILKLKIKHNDWTRVRKQPIISLYFEFENELKFYNFKA